MIYRSFCCFRPITACFPNRASSGHVCDHLCPGRPPKKTCSPTLLLLKSHHPMPSPAKTLVSQSCNVIFETFVFVAASNCGFETNVFLLETLLGQVETLVFPSETTVLSFCFPRQKQTFFPELVCFSPPLRRVRVPSFRFHN